MGNFFSRMTTSGVQRQIQGKLRAVYLNLSMHQSHLVVVVQSLNHIRLFTTPWTAACQAPLSSTISQSSLKFMSIELVVLSNHLILCHCLLLPSIFPSIRIFSSESALHIRWPKFWSFFSISPSNKCSGLISFRIDWFDLLAVQGTLQSLLQHHSLKALLVWGCTKTVQVDLPHR